MREFIKSNVRVIGVAAILAIVLATTIIASANAGLSISPASGNWNYTPSFIVENTSNEAITVSWLVDCWDESVCQDSAGTVTLQHGQMLIEGAGNVCTKWQLDLEWAGGSWGGIVEPQCQPPTETPQPPTETPAPPEETPVPSETPEPPTNTPVPPVRNTPEPTLVPWQPEWRACDAKIEDVLPSQMAEWMDRCQPQTEEVVVAETVATPEPACADCGSEARFELLDNAVVYGGLFPGDNRGTFYTRGEGILTSENVSLIFENRGLKVYRWVDEATDAGNEEWACSAEPQIEQFQLVDGVILYRVLPQNSRWDLEVVFEDVDDATLDQELMIKAWYEFSRTSDANFGFRPVGTYTPGMEDQVWSQLGEVFGIRIEAQIAHDTEPTLDYTALQIATAAIREYTLKGIEAIIASVAQKGTEHGVQMLSNADLTRAAAQLSAPANTTSGTSLAFALPFVLVLGGLGFEANRRRKGNEREAA